MGARSALREAAAALPRAPGCYFFYGEEGELLYIGKAKSLRNRVSSYFSQEHYGKTARLVRETARLCHVETENETEALLLECRLIKENNPRFNRIMREDVRFSYIRADLSADFPGLQVVRKKEEDGALYIGGFFSQSDAFRVLEIMQALWGTPDCNRHPLRRERLCGARLREDCLAPCEGKDAAAYHAVLEEVLGFFNGGGAAGWARLNAAMEECQSDMEAQSAALAFEDAAESLAMLKRLRHFAAKSRKLQAGEGDAFVFIHAFREEGYSAYFIREGRTRQHLRMQALALPGVRARRGFLGAVARDASYGESRPEIRCLAEVSADKLYAPVPPGISREELEDVFLREAEHFLRL